MPDKVRSQRLISEPLLGYLSTNYTRITHFPCMLSSIRGGLTRELLGSFPQNWSNFKYFNQLQFFLVFPLLAILTPDFACLVPMNYQHGLSGHPDPNFHN